MINHVVVLKFKSNITESDIYSAVTQLSDLKKVIPAMSSFSFGENCSSEQLNKGFTHAFIMQFDDAKGRDLYVNHPEHNRIAAEIIVPMLEEGIESVLVIDYEV